MPRGSTCYFGTANAESGDDAFNGKSDTRNGITSAGNGNAEGLTDPVPAAAACASMAVTIHDSPVTTTVPLQTAGPAPGPEALRLPACFARAVSPCPDSPFLRTRHRPAPVNATETGGATV